MCPTFDMLVSFPGVAVYLTGAQSFFVPVALLSSVPAELSSTAGAQQLNQAKSVCQCLSPCAVHTPCAVHSSPAPWPGASSGTSALPCAATLVMEQAGLAAADQCAAAGAGAQGIPAVTGDWGRCPCQAAASHCTGGPLCQRCCRWLHRCQSCGDCCRCQRVGCLRRAAPTCPKQCSPVRCSVSHSGVDGCCPRVKFHAATPGASGACHTRPPSLPHVGPRGGGGPSGTAGTGTGAYQAGT